MPEPTLPAWLDKLMKLDEAKRKDFGLTPEELEDAKGGYMRQADYTTKTQEVAKLRKLQEKYPDLEPDQVIDTVERWQRWGETQWPSIERELNDLRTRATANPGRTEESKVPQNGRRYDKASVEDFLETERLQRVLGELEDTAYARGTQYVDTKMKELGDGWGTTANGYVATILGLMRPLWTKTYGADAPDIDTVMREMAARQERDPGKVLDTLRGAKQQTYEQGKADAAKEYEEKAKADAAERERSSAAAGAPTGSPPPSWRPAPAETRPKNRDEAFRSVLSAVEKKHGPLPITAGRG